MEKNYRDMGRYNLGIDIGGTFIKYGIVDKELNIVSKWKVKSIPFGNKDCFYDYLCENIKHLSDINKIGVSAPGLIDKESNVKSHAADNVRIMYGTNINYEISKRTGKTIASINDAKSAGLCEFKIGNASGSKSSAFLILGTGTGGCICDESGVIYGKDSFAGEFHYMPLLNFETSKLESMGDYASVDALVKIYNSKVNTNEILKLGNEVCDKYLNEDIIAIESINQFVMNIVTQLINITVFYNPEVICIGGGISEEKWFIDRVRKKYESICKKYLGDNVISTLIKECKYNNDANLLGAILNVIN